MALLGNISRIPKLNYVLLGLVFLVSRVVVLGFQQPATDVFIYAQYAQEYEAASRQGLSFYEYHAQAVQQKIDRARAAGERDVSLEEYKNVEYPPLALAIMRLPRLWMFDRPADKQLSSDFQQRYYFAFRLGMAAADASLFVLLLALVNRLHEAGSEQLPRLLGYLAGTVILWHLLYDRLDLLLAAMIVLALSLLVSRQHYGWSFAMLALAINFKLVPLVLAPIWVAGSMPATLRNSLGTSRLLVALAIRCAFLLVLVLGCFLPFYLSAGNRCLGFLSYHRERGVEIGSLYGSVLMALKPLGHAVEVHYAYGSINLRSSLSPVLAALAPWLASVLLLGATALLLVRCSSLTARSPSRDSVSCTLAQLSPCSFVCYTLLFLMLFVATNKVFSPQYLLWLAPLVSLLPFGGWRRRLFFWGFLVTCLLTTVLVPFLFVSDLIEPDPARPVAFWTFKGPTTRVAVLLALRNLLFLGLATGLAMQLFRGRRARQAGEAQSLGSRCGER